VGYKRSPGVPLVVRQVPRIHGMSLDVARPGEELLIRVSGWQDGVSQVLVDGVPVAPFDVQPEFVRLRVPRLAEGRVVSVVVAAGEDRSRPAELVIGRLPALASIEPSTAMPGDQIALRGRGFHGQAPEYGVSIGGVPALVVGVEGETVQAIVPLVAAGSQPVEIRVPGYSSTATGTMTVNPLPEPVGFRFVAQPLEGDPGRAAVVSVTGTVFPLADAGDRSAAERASEAARRLNAAGETMASLSTVAIQAQPGPTETSLVLAEADEPLLEITDADVAAIAAEQPPRRGRGAEVTRERLVVWWAAVLGDLGLVLGKGAPPGYAAGLAPEGRVLQDVQQSVAASGGRFSRSIVLRARPEVREALATLARRVPAAVRAP
jgi:hypothetical protein